MHLHFSAEIERFREDVRQFIRSNLPDDIRRLTATEQMDLPRELQVRWHRILHARGGWGCPSWPVEHGGPGWSDEQQYVFERELALADAPRPMIYGVSMLGPTIMAFGTDEQKRRILPAIARGEVFWCQGFSEPNAGSDLAALRCRADRDGNEYVINGSKIWTSEAHHADRLFGLFRTDRSGKKQHGITFLLVDLRADGVHVSPIQTFDGGREVNEVFFDDVRVAQADRVGEENGGWTVAKYLLGLERFGTAEVSRSMRSLERLQALAADQRANGRPLADDPMFARRMAEVEIELRALEITEQRFLFGPGGADALGPEASMLKIRGTEVQQRILALTLDGLGYQGHVDQPESAEAGANVAAVGPPIAAVAARNYFNYRKTSIYSGSNEIQKNIVAKAVLDL